MFLGITEALDAIIEAIKEGLGPVTELKITGAHVRDMIVQICATLILFLAVRFLFWKPVTDFLEARRQAIDESLDKANESYANAKRLEEEMTTQMTEAKAKIKVLLDNAERDGNEKRETIIAEAKEEAKRRMKALEDELEQEKANMANEIRQEIVEIAFAAAEKIVAKEIDQDKYLDIVDEILKETK
jgi:F-type H+-transporting ATPase subunit b